MTFGQKVSKLNSRPVYCSRLYGIYKKWLVKNSDAIFIHNQKVKCFNCLITEGLVRQRNVNKHNFSWEKHFCSYEICRSMISNVNICLQNSRSWRWLSNTVFPRIHCKCLYSNYGHGIVKTNQNYKQLLIELNTYKIYTFYSHSTVLLCFEHIETSIIWLWLIL